MSNLETIEIPVPKDLYSFEPITKEQLQEAWETMIKPALEASAKIDRKPSRSLRAIMAVLSAVEPALDGD